MTREEKMEHWMIKYNHAARINRSKYFDDFDAIRNFTWTLPHIGVSPMQLHTTMFLKTIE